MATLTADRHLAHRSLLDPREEEGTRTPHPPTRRFSKPHQPTAQPPRPRPTTFAEPTLDDLVAGAWDELTVTHAASCVVCGDDLSPRFSSGPQPVAAGCAGCGAQLS
jgi:hypothetical protein